MDRDDLLRHLDLADLLDELSPGPPTRLGPTARWRCIDPGHDDQHPSVSMFTDRRGIQRWRCWSGGHGGTAIDALLIAHGGTVSDALTELRRRAGDMEVGHHPPMGRVEQPAAPQLQLPAPHPSLLEYVDACSRALWRPEGRRVLDYLRTERGLDADVLRANHVGADLGPAAMRRAPGLPRGGVAAVLPTHSPDGAITYVQARYLDPADGRPKYDNPAGRLAANPRLSWMNVPSLRDPGTLVICEGSIDALCAAGTGVAAVAFLGATYVNRATASAVAAQAGGRNLVVLFDADPAGHTAADLFTDELDRVGIRAQVLTPPAGSDLNGELVHDDQWLRRLIDPPPMGPPPVSSTAPEFARSLSRR